MPSDIPIYTQSSNFGSLLEKGVDARTGQYTCAIDVWGAPTEARNCPSLNLTLSFNPLNFFNFGLGQGWSFNLTTYDDKHKTLYLSTGEQFKVTESTHSVSVPDQKLKSFKFLKGQKEENGRKFTYYQVAYKSGQVEILQNSSGILNRFVPFQISAANGRRLRLVWDILKQTGYPLLTKIQEASQSLLEVDYKSIDKKIIRFPDTPEQSTLSLEVRDNRLKKLVLPLPSAPSWTFDYKLYGPSLCITQATSPSGLVEQLDYKLDGHRLPPKAPYKYMPHVEWHTVWPGNSQPRIKTQYEFSPLNGHNCFGYNAGLEWNDGEDNLYRTRLEYTYTSIVTVQGGTKTTNTYNHFHLLISARQEKDSCVVTETISYHANPYEKFQNQPASCQLPRTTSKTYKDHSGRSRSETTEQTYDEWGNPTLEIRPDGVQIHRTFYSEKGEDPSDSDSLGCPPDPHGFRRYMRTETVVPRPSDYSAPTRTETYRYVKIPTAHGADAAYFVGAQQQLTSHGSQVLSRTRFAYLDNPTATYHGRLQKQVTSHLDKYPTTKTWSYNRNGDRVVLTTGTTTFDGALVEEETVYSTLHGLTLAHKDQVGVEDCFCYNTLGQITKATTSAGTPQEAVRQWEYAVLEQNYGTETIVTDAKGVKTRYVTDGLERPCRMEKQDPDEEVYAAGNNNTPATFRLVEQRNYNAQGQCTEIIDVDWLRAENGQRTRQETRKQLEYDGWGGVYKTMETSGLVTMSTSDPIDLTETTGIEGEGSTKTYRDMSGNPTLIHLYTSDKTLYGSIKYRYDGLGRLVEEEDQLGRITQYKSDGFDRITKTTWSDSRTVTTDYAEHAEVGLPAKVSLNGVTVGEQCFDGLGRLKLRKVGQRTIQQIYEGHAPEPNRITNAKGQQCEIAYEPTLQFTPKSLTTSDAHPDGYEYDPQTAMPTKLEGSYSTQTREYTSSSLLQNETIHIKGGESFSSEYQYSMAGLLQRYVNPHQQKQSIEYDADGRPASLVQGQIRVSFTYCKSGRLSEYSVEDQDHAVKLTFLLSYDDFGRETNRTVKKGETVMYSLSQTYGETSLVATRTLKDKEGVTVRDERLTYDHRSRLTKYECDGSRAPVDQQGNQIRTQIFDFDEYDNVVKQTTTFHDQDPNTASYTFNKDDPTQLISITNTNNAYPKRVVLEYDANGSLTQDEQGRKLEYDTLGRLIRVRDANHKQLCEYHYDASGKLACQSVPDQPDTILFYREDSLIATKNGDRRVSYVSNGKAYWGQIIQDGELDQPQNELWASDGCGSVLAWLDSHQPEDMHSQSYTPYGFGGETGIAFNGQWKDPVTGWYHLGNGYRVYNPVLMRFHAADPWSPFTSGEVNPYTYCLGDPVNRMDPSGHFSMFGVNFGWKMLISAAVGIAASIAVGVLTAGASLAVQVALGAVVGAITAPIGAAVGDLAEGRTPTWGSVGTESLLGFVGGAAGPVVGKYARAFLGKFAKSIMKSGTFRVSQSVNNSVWRLGLEKHIAGHGIRDIVTSAAQATAIAFLAKQPLVIGGAIFKANVLDKRSSDTAPQSKSGGALQATGASQVDVPYARTGSALPRDSIRPLLKEGSSVFSGYSLQAISPAMSNSEDHASGQSIAEVLNLSSRCSYGLSRKGQGGSGDSGLYSGLRGTLRASLDRNH